MRTRAGIAALLFGAVLLGSCAQGPRDIRGGALRPVAEPGTVVATELAFARLAREKGQWTAFREFAAEDAVMFVPEPVNARDWLKDRANPAQSVEWKPHQVWSSCDGTLAVTKGAWQQADGSFGYFTTVWERQEDGDYKWVLDMGEPLDEPLVEQEMVQAEVADCDGSPAPVVVTTEYSRNRHDGLSSDETLFWLYYEPTRGGRELGIYLWQDGRMGHIEIASSGQP